MSKRTFRKTGLFKAACALALTTLLYQLYTESTYISSFRLKSLPRRQLENMSLHQPRKEKGLAFLSENEILQRFGNKDIINISMGKYSKAYLERRTYSLGEEIKVKIILYNGRGEKKMRGGDYLRLWMENVKVKATVSGKVMDNNDGTYSGRVRAMWSGEADIRVMILGRREEISRMYQLYNRYHMLVYINAVFTNGDTTETSQCSVAPYDAKQKWCNFTAENAGFPWFCTEPTEPGLSCNMWNETWSRNHVRGFPGLTSLDLRTASNEVDLLTGRSQRISGTTDRVASPVIPCNKVAPDVTWNRKSPQGFFYEDQWHSTQCTDTLNHTPTVYKECLRGRTLYLHGDSTSGQFFNYLNGILNLNLKRAGHFPAIKSDLKYNFTLSWYAHEFPFYHGRKHYRKSIHLAQHILLDRIKNNSRDIVILYLYVHFTLNHPDVFKQHVHRLAQSARDLIARAPGVTIGVRGPHAFTKGLLHSYWGLQYMDTLHKAFALIQKNVLFLDYWDLTMARLPDDQHPPMETVAVMVRYMMSLVCNRNNH